jgi:hypothetical protein
MGFRFLEQWGLGFWSNEVLGFLWLAVSSSSVHSLMYACMWKAWLFRTCCAGDLEDIYVACVVFGASSTALVGLGGGALLACMPTRFAQPADVRVYRQALLLLLLTLNNLAMSHALPGYAMIIIIWCFILLVCGVGCSCVKLCMWLQSPW